MLKRWFHRHSWAEQSRVHVPPLTAKNVEFTSSAQGTMLHLTSGFTSVLLQCAVCGDVKEETVLGDHSKK